MVEQSINFRRALRCILLLLLGGVCAAVQLAAQTTAAPVASPATPAQNAQPAKNSLAVTLDTLPQGKLEQPSSQNQPAANAGGADATNGEYSIRATVNEVDLVFTVVDKHGHFISDLQESDFALLDNRLRPAEVFSFTQRTNMPLRVGLLIDASNSIRSRFHFEQDAAAEFMLDILRPQVDKAFVMGFDVVPQLTQDYTNNGDLLQAGIHKLEPGGGTALYDAVYTACRDKMLPLHSATNQRKAIILLSDGDDNQSHADLDDAVKMCQRADTILYAVSTNNSPSRDRGDDVLKAMAQATGGSAFYPPRMEDVAVAFRSIQEELRSQYALVYKPADFKADGAFRPIYLVAMDRRYKVRVRKGYFAPK